MADYIKREDIIRDMKRHCVDCDNRKSIKNGKMVVLYDIGDAPCRSCALGCMIDIIEDYPAADVRENVRRKWEVIDDKIPDGNMVRCSQCGNSEHLEYNGELTWNFCPICGVDTRGDDDGKL